MRQEILDLHIHSKYSRACSRDLLLPNIAVACKTRGITIAATGDFTHPKWFGHIRENLIEDGSGLYTLVTPPFPGPALARPVFDPSPTRGGNIPTASVKFILGTEIALIKKHKDKTRRVHVLLFAPSIESVEKLNAQLTSDGFNLASDGRPILGMTCREFLEYVLAIDERMVVIPAHAWTPWFGILGSKGGYDSLEDAFDDLAPHIFAIETGLSSDPLMNWQVSSLDHISLISNSDAHSPAKLGREANVMRFDDEKAVTYDEIMRILRENDRNRFVRTIEFYPEEGKYHYDGHRDCAFVCHPSESKKYGNLCPKCKKPLVLGVMHRVTELADRTEDAARTWGKDHRVPYASLVPLPEIIGSALSLGVNSKRVRAEYDRLIAAFDNEFTVLLSAAPDAIERASSVRMRSAIERVRSGHIVMRPGYDGEFGVVEVFGDAEQRPGIQQLGLDLL